MEQGETHCKTLYVQTSVLSDSASACSGVSHHISCFGGKVKYYKSAAGVL